MNLLMQACRTLAWNGALSVGSQVLEVEGKGRWQDKRTHIAWRFWGGRLLVLQGFWSLPRNVWQISAHCDFRANGSFAGRCRTLRAV